MRKALIYLVMLLAMAGAAHARPVEDWPYDRLMREADVVVIGSVKSEVASDIQPQGPLVATKAIAQLTTFDVHVVVKGDPGSSVDVLHFRLPDGTVTKNGPLLARFRKDGPRVQPDSSATADKAVVKLSPPDYLLFLKRTEGGRLEPVSGQYDSELSVREIYMPLPALLDGHRR